MEMVTANGPKTTFNRHRTHACLPETPLFGEVAINIASKVGVFSHNS
jgi:hypothetical protein